MFCMSDLDFFIVLSKPTGWIIFFHRQNADMCSPYKMLGYLHQQKLRKKSELMAAVGLMNVICPAYEGVRYLIRVKISGEMLHLT